MSIASAIVAGVTATAEVAEAIQKMGTMLDTPRSIILIFENKTKYVLEKESDFHKHGGFAATPVHVLKPQQAEVFGSRDTGFLTGNEGGVTYKLQGLTPETFVGLTWGNPFIGPNSAGGVAYNLQTFASPPGFPPLRLPVPSPDFRMLITCGGGDKDVEMRYTLLLK